MAKVRHRNAKRKKQQTQEIQQAQEEIREVVIKAEKRITEFGQRRTPDLIGEYDALYDTITNMREELTELGATDVEADEIIGRLHVQCHKARISRSVAELGYDNE